ncbi:MAG: right-handed parallel beta-helix repeat-containing protein [Phycisphaeraceae bacterium]
MPDTHSPSPSDTQHGCDASLAHPASGRVWLVANQHPDASDENDGAADRPLRTITAAAWRAQPGDVVQVCEGTYRERVAPRYSGKPDCPIVYQAAPGEQVVIKASDLWQPHWRSVPDERDIVYAAFDPALFRVHDPQAEDWPDFPASYNPFAIAMLAAPCANGAAIDPYGETHGESSTTQASLVVGELFSRGEPLLQVADWTDLRRHPGSWLAAADGMGLYLHPPVDRQALGEQVFELTTRSRCFAPYRRGLGHIHVRGFVMEHGATNFPSGFYHAKGAPQAGVLSTRSGHHWLIEHNTIRFGTSLGLDIGSEGTNDADGLEQDAPPRGATGHHIIRFNTISDHGGGGIAGINSPYTRILHNRIERNNRLGFTSPETGGIKLHFFLRGHIEGNLIRDNRCYGLWLDNMWHEARVTRNTIITNQGAGLFIELGNGPLMVDHNVIAQTSPGVREPGDGVYSHDASGVTFAHNLVMDNAHFGLWAHAATDREPGIYQDGKRVGKEPGCASRWTIANNLFFANHAGELCLPPEHPRSTGNRCDANLFAGSFDRWTHETFAQPFDRPLFAVTTNKRRIDEAHLARQIVDALKQANLPGADNLSPDRVRRVPFLTLEEWQCVTGFDQHSRWPTLLRLNFAPGTTRLTFFMDDAAQQVPTLRFETLDGDYFGQPLPERPLPGPFQQIKPAPPLCGLACPADAPPNQFGRLDPADQNCIVLWPLSATTVDRDATVIPPTTSAS